MMASEKTERMLLAEISEKLDRLVGAALIQGKDQATQLDILYRLGFDSAQIGQMLGITAGAVRKHKSRKAKTSRQAQ